jgi:HK97 family phage major capsid protein
MDKHDYSYRPYPYRSSEVPGQYEAKAEAIIRRRGAQRPSLIFDLRQLTDDEVRDAALRLLDDRETVRTFRSSATGDDLDRTFRNDPSIARTALVTETVEYRSALMKMLTAAPGQSPESVSLTDRERAAMRRARETARAQSGSTSAAGGYSVPPTVDPSVTVSDFGSINPYMQLCRIEDIITDEWRGLVSAGKAWQFKGENTSSTDASMTSLSQPSIPIYTASGFVSYSIELGDGDWPNFAAHMSSALADGYNELLLNKLTNGSGAGECTGLLVALAAASPSVIVTSAVDGALSDTDLGNTWAALPAKWRQRATRMADSTVANQIRTGSSLYHASAVQLDGSVGSAEILMGKQFVENAAFPTWTSTTGVSTRLCVGSFDQFVFVRRAGIQVETVRTMIDPSTNRPLGQRAVLAYARLGSDVGGTTNAFRIQSNE